MKIKINQIEAEADTLDDIKALVTLALETLTSIPAAPSRPALAIPGASNGDRERELRDTYKAQYGKGFSMKGKAGGVVEHLEALEAAGWPKGGADDTEALDGPPVTQADDGASFV